MTGTSARDTWPPPKIYTFPARTTGSASQPSRYTGPFSNSPAGTSSDVRSTVRVSTTRTSSIRRSSQVSRLPENAAVRERMAWVHGPSPPGRNWNWTVTSPPHTMPSDAASPGTKR